MLKDEREKNVQNEEGNGRPYVMTAFKMLTDISLKDGLSCEFI
jgi:hypothetical protein